MFLGPWACGSECCSSNSNAPDTSQKGLIGIQSHHPREKMSKKAREKPAETGSASVSPYGSVLSYELVTSQPNRLINLIWPECRTWFIGPCNCPLGANATPALPAKTSVAKQLREHGQSEGFNSRMQPLITNTRTYIIRPKPTPSPCLVSDCGVTSA